MCAYPRQQQVKLYVLRAQYVNVDFGLAEEKRAPAFGFVCKLFVLLAVLAVWIF